MLVREIIAVYFDNNMRASVEKMLRSLMLKGGSISKSHLVLTLLKSSGYYMYYLL
jgi:hypothetical protein